MKTKTLKLISMFLILSLIVGMLPMQIFAQEIVGSLDANDNISISTEAAQIVAELPEGRTAYSKEYLMSDGLHMAIVYANAVHYEKDGVWEDIDNTLTAHLDGTYQNTAGPWTVSLPQQSGVSSAVTIQKDGYTLSFGLPQKLSAGNGGAEVMSAGGETFTTQAVSTVTAQVEATLDVSQAKAQAEHPQTVLEKMNSRMTYQNIHSQTDVVYDLDGTRLKESIVMARYDSALRGYRYTLDVGQLIPRPQEDGSILFYDSTETTVVMLMEAPFLIDADQELSEDIQVSLTGGNGGKYTLTYTLPQQWLAAEERAWPVVLDPVVTSSTLRANIHDVFIDSAGVNKYNRGYLDLGYEGTVKKRSYVKFLNLPRLDSADIITSAFVGMFQMYYRSISIPAEVYKVKEDWDQVALRWSNQPSYETTVTDFVRGHNAVEYNWDITDIVQEWYATGENYGLLFKTTDEIEDAGEKKFRQFYSADYGLTYRPYMQITFKNNNGLESYWDYSSASAGRAGTGYINNYAGNLVWTRDDLGFGGNRMSVSISHIYNTNDISGSFAFSGNAIDLGLGHGWRTNYNQIVDKTRTQYEDGTYKDDEVYYYWQDGDGTKHYFDKDKNTGIYMDEDGLGLTLTISGSGENISYTITDKSDNTFYFDSLGRLYKQENNQQTRSSISITYTAADSYRIASVTDGAGRLYQFTYGTDGLLSRIGYYGNTSQEIANVTYTYNNDGDLICVTDKDGEFSTYTYSEPYIHPETGETVQVEKHRLTTAEDVDGYRLSYTYHLDESAYAPARVKSVTESHGSALGGKLTFQYDQNQSVLTSYYPDESGEHQKENAITYQFNNEGATISVRDEEGRAQYHTFGWEDSSTGAKGSQLAFSSKLQNTVTNLLYDSSFEGSTLWTPDLSAPTMTHGIASSGYMGSKSLQIGSCSAEFLCSPTVTVAAGKTVTFSGYVKTTAGQVKLGLRNQNVQEDTVYSDSLSTNGEWERLQVSYTNRTDAAVTLYACFMGLDNATAYLDCVQLEEAPTASRYNLVNNGDFRNGTTGWTLSIGSDGLATAEPAAPQLDENVMRVNGNYTGTKTITQTIQVSGSAGDSFVFSGWAKGRSAALKGLLNGMDKQYLLRFTFHNTNGTTTVQDVSFNANLADWQFVSAAAVAANAYSSVSVQLRFHCNANRVCFDGVQVFKEEFGTTYTYGDDGNVISTVDLQKKETTYQYDTNNNLTAILEDNQAKMTYAYDNWHNVISATSQEGLSYAFVYDTYGNNTKVSIVSGDVTISTEAEYTTDGNLLLSTTDALGQETLYGYDENTGVLYWVQYPEETEATRTSYTYDEIYRKATMAATTDTGKAMSAAYTYTDDYRTKIQTPTTAYNFTYGNFGLQESVKIGNQVFKSFQYDLQNRLQRLDYGNGDHVQYTYDSQSRLIRETYEDGSTVSYTYDNMGAKATMSDSATGRTTTYFYDLIDRLVKYEEKGANFSHSVTYTYDGDNNLQSLTETVNGVKMVYTYTYDDDNRVTSVAVGDGTTTVSTVTYSYDAFGRRSQQVTKHGDAETGTTVLTENTTFTNPSATATSGQIASFNGFTYTFDGNGNVISVTQSGLTATYQYDSANQLIRENNEFTDYTQVWTYDNAGNILGRETYYYTEDADLSQATLVDSATYTYGNSNWGDLLTSYNGQAITYDAIGNPLTWGDRSFTWNYGRQLASLTENGTTWQYTYDASGLRTKRTDGTNTYEYVYDGTLLSAMTKGNDTLLFTYDTTGLPLTVTLNNTVYYYHTNYQGDVIYILDSDGDIVVEYVYDAWGELRSVNGDLSATLGILNPLRYRSYVYDTETGLYYLSSRYYNPALGRFLNADIVVSTEQGFLGNNMFVYCLNDPIGRKDIPGTTSQECFEDDGNPTDDDKDIHGGNMSNVKSGETANSGAAGQANGSGGNGSASTSNSGSSPIPEDAYKILDYVKNHNGSPPNGQKGGRIFKNDGRNGSAVLPDQYAPYREYDIYPKFVGQSRGSERIVIGNGIAFYTPDHYATFAIM